MAPSAETREGLEPNQNSEDSFFGVFLFSLPKRIEIGLSQQEVFTRLRPLTKTLKDYRAFLLDPL